MKRVSTFSTVLKYYTLLRVHIIIPLHCSSEPSMLKHVDAICWQIWLLNLDNFLVSPGWGRDYTFSPVGVNATLDCKVANNDLSWSINNIGFDRPNARNLLHNRGIFQSELVPSSDGLFSTLFVFGNVSNNVSMVCCVSLLEEQTISCTTLIIYGKLYLLLSA